MNVFRHLLIWLIVLAPFAIVVPAYGQETKKKEATEAAKDANAEWAKLRERKQEIAERLEKLQADFAKADDDGKLKIRNEFQKLLTEFQEVYPKMQELAPKIYRENPDDLDAAEVVMELAYQGNRYDESAEIADKLIAAERATPFVVNVAGASHFATHDFEQAAAILKKAKEDGHLDTRVGQEIGARFLGKAEEYVELWEKEQAIRKQEAAAQGDEQLPRVLLKTSRGDVELELFENEAPNTVANFISLVESKKYDGTKFHRVLPHFMAQGGDPNSKDDDPSDDGGGGPGYTIKCECYEENARMHFRGSLSMAHAGKDTGGSQFFLTHLPTYWLNPNPLTERGHTVFGRVVKGMDVVAALEIGDEITSATVTRKRDHEYKPETQPEA